LALVGDALAQSVDRKTKLEKNEPHQFDLMRMARMGLWGLIFYGPLQHWWYRELSGLFPGKETKNFLIKVGLNQIILGPVVLSSVWTWTLTLQGHKDQILGKLSRELLPCAINGWKFWVPAACVNFWIIPLRYQVLYMSTCGILWSAYLSYTSYSSSTSSSSNDNAAAAAAGAKKTKSKKK